MTTSSKPRSNWRHCSMPAMSNIENQKAINPTQSKNKAAHPPAETLRHALEEIQQLRTRAKTQGHAQGHKEGFTKGHELGLQQGLNEGHEKGHNKGFEKGYQAGLERDRKSVV